jgi:hypothetical protein
VIEIKTKHAALMFFRSEKYRDAAEGEIFNVLAYRPELKKVFVLAKGEDGKDIALAIDADAVELVPADTAAALAKARAAVDAKNFALCNSTGSWMTAARGYPSPFQAGNASVASFSNAARLRAFSNKSISFRDSTSRFGAGCWRT